VPLVCRTSQRRVSLWHEKSVRLDAVPPWLVRVYNGLVPGVESPSTDRARRTFCRDEPERPAASDGWSGTGTCSSWRPKRNRTHLRNGFGESGFETTLGVTNRVALLPSRQPVDFGFQRPDNDSQLTVVMAEGPRPTRIWIAGGQNFSPAGAVQSPEPRVMQDASFAGEEELYEGEIEIMLPVRVVPGAAPGTHNLVVSASYQSCNNKLCLPPKTMKAEVPVTIGE